MSNLANAIRCCRSYDLYVVLDIFSASSWAWTIATCEDSKTAKTTLGLAMGVHGIPEAIHADRGTSMTSKPVAQLMVDLGFARSHSRPHVSTTTPTARPRSRP